MIELNLQFFGGRGSGGDRNTTTPSKSLDELRAERTALANEYREFIASHADSQGALNRQEDIDKLIAMQTKLDEVDYQLFTQLSPVVKEEKWKGSGITDLTRDEASTVRQDMIKNKEMYMAIASAQHGVAFGDTTNDTAVDSLYNRNPDKTYKVFEPTRAMLRKKYGDTITLYRVPTAQTAKATVNMTSTKSNAEQYAKLYGRKVESVKVPVNDVLAVNVSRSGGYEEFIVLNKRNRR